MSSRPKVYRMRSLLFRTYPHYSAICPTWFSNHRNVHPELDGCNVDVGDVWYTTTRSGLFHLLTEHYGTYYKQVDVFGSLALFVFHEDDNRAQINLFQIGEWWTPHGGVPMQGIWRAGTTRYSTSQYTGSLRA